MMLTQSELKQILNYDPDTGIFVWINPRSKRAKIGAVAGTIRKYDTGKSYCIICINYQLYRAHRLAWLYIYGSFPVNEIDHINGNGNDNSAINLRSVNHQENLKNMRRHANNTSGICGVHWNSDRCKWHAQITVKNKSMNLGRFDNIFDAACARKSAEKKHGFHKNHGINRPL